MHSYYFISFPSTKPDHVVPPSCVKKPIASLPAVVSVGAVPPTHLTPENQVITAEPPLVTSNIKLFTEPVVATLLTVSVVAPEIVLLK